MFILLPLYSFYTWAIRYLYFLFFCAPVKVPVIAETLQQKTQHYIETKTLCFLKTYDMSGISYSSSISASFYNPQELKDVLDSPDNILESSWKTRILMESTPRGTVIMYYDAYKQGFSYYADTNSLPYPLLNAVAMKYVITYRCRDFFIDDKITPIEQPSPLLPLAQTDTKKTTTVQRKLTNEINPFLRSKRTIQKPDRVGGPEKDVEKEYNTNRFLYLGKCVNFKMLQTPAKKNKMNGFSSQYTTDLSQETDLQRQVLNYGDFKQRKV